MAVVNRKSTAISGILAALVVITLYAESVIPTAKLSLYALSSFFVAIIIIEGGGRAGWLFYLVTSLLVLIIVPDKVGLMPYFVFFGVYGILKFYIEKMHRIVPEYVLKLAYFNICLILALFIIKNLLAVNISSSVPLWLLIISLEVVFLIYDYVYTLFIQFYLEKIKKPEGG